ncbi:MAG TPA: hypothetical protein VKB86_11250 [Pyrinomonadaceae bacterium]|nr:hypothetical protein [Pyrinomonadaceae bacterium]
MERVYFTEEEARSKVGKRIHEEPEFSGVPLGTTVMVISADKARTGYNVAIQWDLPTPQSSVEHGSAAGEPFLLVRGGKPLVDWFSRDEYERYLQEV